MKSQELKLSQLVGASLALQALGALKLPSRTAYRIAKAQRLMKDDLRAYEEARLKLAAELGEKSEDGTAYVFRKEDAKTKEVLFDNTAAFHEQIEALLSETVTVDLPTFTPDDLGDVSVEPNLLAQIDGIVLFEAEEGEKGKAAA